MEGCHRSTADGGGCQLVAAQGAFFGHRDSLRTLRSANACVHRDLHGTPGHYLGALSDHAFIWLPDA